MQNHNGRNLRLLFVISGDIWAGAEVQVFNLASELAKLQYAVSAVVFNDKRLSEALRGQGVDVFVLDENENSGLKILFQLIALFRAQSPDVIHTHGFKENILASFANSFSVRTKCVRTLHGDFETKVPLKRLDKHVTRYMDKFAAKYLQDKVIAVSSMLHNKYEKIYGRGKTALIENTINIADVESSSELQIDEQYDDDIIKLAMVGRLVPLKRHEYIIKSLPSLLEKFSNNLLFYVFGDGPERDRLEKLAESLGVSGNVRFMGDLRVFYPHFKKMDLLVMPSDHEGLPMTLLEALVLKVPVIAHATGGITHLMNEGAFATLVEKHVGQSYRDAIIKVIENVDKTNEMTRKGYEHVRNNYDIGVSVSKYEAIYHN